MGTPNTDALVTIYGHARARPCHRTNLPPLVLLLQRIACIPGISDFGGARVAVRASHVSNSPSGAQPRQPSPRARLPVSRLAGCRVLRESGSLHGTPAAHAETFQPERGRGHVRTGIVEVERHIGPSKRLE